MEYIPYIVLAIVVIVFIASLIYSSKKKGLKQTALEWILIAEKEFQKGENKEKFAYVYKAIYNVLPAYIKVFVSQEVAENILSKFIQGVFDFVKPALDYGVEEVVIDTEVKE